MHSPVYQKVDQVQLKKEFGLVFLRIGLTTFIIGAIGIAIGLLLKNQFHATPLITILPLLAGLPVVLILNWLMIRHAINKITDKSGLK
jgi:hypothetical protein